MKLLVRADASTNIGSGHVMRCLALAQAWQDHGGEVLFVMAEGTEAMAARLEEERMSINPLKASVNSSEDALRTLALAEEREVDWLVVDGYRFDADYQYRLKKASGKLLVLDDFGQASFYWADLILNQNAHANTHFYSRRLPTTGLLLGLDYALLRREFYSRSWQFRDREQPPRRLLITFGGGDPHNLTERVLTSLLGIDDLGLEVITVLGANNPHRYALEALIRQTGLRVCLKIGVNDMSELFIWADLAISGGGSTLWELAYMGVPALVLTLAENQEPSSQLLDRLGSIQCLGHPDLLTDAQIASAITGICRDPQRLHYMERCGRQLVDGKGAQRVVQQMLLNSNRGDK